MNLFNPGRKIFGGDFASMERVEVNLQKVLWAI